MTNKFSNYLEWDTENWSSAMKFWEKKVDLTGKNFRCLELGARRGGLSYWLAEKGNQVICSDIFDPQETADEFHKEHNVSNLISYEVVDATQIPYKNHFDIVIFKSVLGGIGRNGHYELIEQAMNGIYDSLKKRGYLLFAENLKSSKLHQFIRQKFVRWGKSWNYLTKGEMENALKIYSYYEYETCGFLGTFGINEWQKRILGKLDHYMFNPLVGPNNHYIIYGYARK